MHILVMPLHASRQFGNSCWPYFAQGGDQFPTLEGKDRLWRNFGNGTDPRQNNGPARYRKMRYYCAMRLISNKALREFASLHPPADAALQGWRRVVEQSVFRNFAELKQAFNAVDKVGNSFVFNIAGNRYRLIAAIHFNTQVLYVRRVMTHAEYDQWRP